MELIFTIAGVIALIVLLKFGMLVRVARGLRLRRGECGLRDAADLPAYFADLRLPLETELSRLGFCYSHTQLDESPFVGPVSRKWVLVYENPAMVSYAEVSLTDIPEPARPFAVTFVTLFSDRNRLITMNGFHHGLVGSIPRTVVQDPYTEDLPGQWEVHRSGLEGLKSHGRPVLLQPAEYAQGATELQRDFIRSLMNQDWIDPVGGGRFRLRWAPALRVAARLFRGEGKLNALLDRSRKRYRERQGAVSIPLEVEIESFRRISHLQEGQGMGWAGKLALLAATMVFFAVSMGIGSSWSTALIITGVILLHEGGHYLGMKLFRYQDVRVLFLPFLGAVTVGRQHQTPLHRRVVVFMLGPVPGIVAGTALLLSPPAQLEWVRTLALMLLAINYLNLLPVVPLDGGQVFNLFFSRLPLLRALFQAACGAALLAASAALDMDRLLFFLGLMILLGSVTLLRRRGLINSFAQRLPREGADRSEAALLPVIFGLLREAPHRDKPFREKFQTATFLLRNVPEAAPSLRLVLGTTFAYLAVFVLPLALMAGRMLLSGPGFAGDLLFPQPDRGAEVAALARIAAMKPDPEIRLTPADEELARTIGFEAGVLLRVKQLSGGEIVRLTVEDDRPEPAPAAGFAIVVPASIAGALVLNLREELAARGFVPFVDQMNYGNGDDRVGVIRGADSFEVLRLKKTDGINYGHTSDAVLARLEQWHRATPLTIVGAGRDWVDLEFETLPADLDAFAKEVYEFCPDTVDQGFPSVAELASALKASRRLYLWWD